MFEHKKLDWKKVMPITIAFVIHIVFNNLSLQYNSVGFYQLVKILMTPITALIQFVSFGVNLHKILKTILFFVCIGVIIGTVTDVSANLKGTFMASIGLLSGVYYQLFIKTKQKALGVGSFQILAYQAPQACALVLLITPLFDQIEGETGLIHGIKNMNTELLIVFTAACSIAFLVNLSMFLVVGYTSPISYQVLGMFKTAMTLIGGVVVRDIALLLRRKKCCRGMRESFKTHTDRSLMVWLVFAVLQRRREPGQAYCHGVHGSRRLVVRIHAHEARLPGGAGVGKGRSQEQQDG
jgi:solute carrier family 35 protein E3